MTTVNFNDPGTLRKNFKGRKRSTDFKTSSFFSARSPTRKVSCEFSQRLVQGGSSFSFILFNFLNF